MINKVGKKVLRCVKQCPTVGDMKREGFIGLRLDRDVEAWLKRASKKKRTTMSEMVRQIIYREFDKRHAKSISKAMAE